MFKYSYTPSLTLTTMIARYLDGLLLAPIVGVSQTSRRPLHWALLLATGDPFFSLLFGNLFRSFLCLSLCVPLHMLRKLMDASNLNANPDPKESI